MAIIALLLIVVYGLCAVAVLYVNHEACQKGE
jgi:cell division protein FtsL